MAWTEFIGPILNIAGKVLDGSGEKASAGAKTQAALSGASNSAARISEHARLVTGFIDPDVDVKSGRGTAAEEAFISLYENPSSPQIAALERLQSRLQEAQQRA